LRAGKTMLNGLKYILQLLLKFDASMNIGTCYEMLSFDVVAFAEK